MEAPEDDSLFIPAEENFSFEDLLRDGAGEGVVIDWQLGNDDGPAPDDDELVSTPPESEDGNFGDDELVEVAADSYTWKVDHSKGDHKLRGLFTPPTIAHSALRRWATG